MSWAAREVLVVLVDAMETVIEKNAEYGDSYARPQGTLSKLDPLKRILARIDEKLDRLAVSTHEDTLRDLVVLFAFAVVFARRAATADSKDAVAP